MINTAHISFKGIEKSYTRYIKNERSGEYNKTTVIPIDMNPSESDQKKAIDATRLTDPIASGFNGRAFHLG